MFVGQTNTDNRYQCKVIGDSPELYRALDSHGFADLDISLAHCSHCSLSCVYAVNYPRRFNMGNPAKEWSSMMRCWQVDPTSERILEDVLALPGVLKKIIAAKGCVVQDQYLRSDLRARRADDKGNCKSKPVSKQRKSTPDCQAAFKMLTGDS